MPNSVQMHNNYFHYETPIELFRKKKMVTLCAPMVRYSKLPFRSLVRRYGCDIAFTPMIVSESFVSSEQARDIDFTTNMYDRPLIVQFAAKNADELADAAEIVFPYSDGVDLNCGCPQRWAIQQGYGACLLDSPELVKNMVYQVRNRVDEQFTVSVKIRIHDDIKRTVEFCRRAEKSGISWISVHGRTKHQRNEPINFEAIKLIKENVGVPVVGNGDVFHLNDALHLQKITGVNGVMSARGLLQNPSLFTGSEYTSLSCVKEWVDLSMSLGNSFHNLHHHLMFMLEKIMPRSERKVFNSHTSITSVVDHLVNNLG